MAYSKCGFLKYMDCRRVVLRNGFVEQRHVKSSHAKFNRGSEVIVLSTLGVSKMIWRRLCKTYKLNEEV